MMFIQPSVYLTKSTLYDNMVTFFRFSRSFQDSANQPIRKTKLAKWGVLHYRLAPKHGGL